MKHWQRTLVGPDAPLRQVLKVIDAAAEGLALVVDDDRRLLGTLSDGDVRRALIRGAELDQPCGTVANTDPVVVSENLDLVTALTMLRARRLRQLPRVDSEGRVTGLLTVKDLLDVPERPEAVVIMAGGRGERLAELTRTTPKPMLNVGPRPILETIVSSLAVQGFRRIFLSVNYRGEQIEAHFGDGSDRGLAIGYLREDRPLGTCGSLSLLPAGVDGPVLVTNGDVLTRVDYGQVMDGHIRDGAAATVVVRDYEMQVPFGVIRAADGRISGIEEKPSQVFNINAGVYVLSRAALALIPANRPCDMPTLIQALIDADQPVRPHRAEGYWLDIGRPPDYDRANAEFGDVFGG
ncbi:nucleotidyltransferase family protein [Brevundimonas sp.]|uniref:nucleotidyltransferase family protein n=1 Tax=Brevundimonas sp. TaxID=1871086 RepID=UPI003AF9B4FB